MKNIVVCKLRIVGWTLCRYYSPVIFENASTVRCYATQPKASYLHYIGEDQLVYRTIGQQLDITAEKFPNVEAIVSYHEGKRHTFASLRDVVDRLAAGFRKLGLQKGDHVGIWGPNTMQWYVTLMGLARVGLVTVGINPAFQAPESDYCLQKVGVKAIIATESYKTQRYYEMLESICPEIGDSPASGHIKSQRLPQLNTVIIDSESRLPGAFKFNDVLDLAGKDEVQQVDAMQFGIEADLPCNIQFTSGTTGQPKATVLTHFNVVNNGYNIGKRNELNNQRICVQVPLFHGFGVTVAIAAALCHGATIVLPSPGFSPEASLKSIVDEKCTVIYGTPTMYVDLIQKQRELQLPIKTAEIAVTGGAPCSSQLFKDIKEVLGLKKVKTVFGMTEITAVAFQSRVDDDEDKVLNTVGHIQDHLEAKVIDENGDTVPFGTAGELCIRGYSVMMNYFCDDEKTKETLTACRWLQTGDQFIIHENGYGQIVGRLKEMIIRGGENIFPKEIEDFLGTHPDILETHVIGVDDERLGEELCAYIRLHDSNKSLTQEDIKKFSSGKIAHFKIPRYVRIVKNFPKTTSGKIQKFKLKQFFEAEQKGERAAF